MGFPFNEQLPNIGRVNKDYSFTIANTTYKSNSDGVISYQVENLPSWLSFDSSSRTFTGKPQESDVGLFEITLIGTDSTDQSQLSNNYTMMVSNDTGLYLTSQALLYSELSKSGQTNGNGGLVVKPGDKIKIQFEKNLFKSYSSSDRPIIAYYGRSADRSSLPNWIYFDGDTLTFSGTVPYVTSENAPSIDYSFSFIASDYYGFAGAEGKFKIVVGGHQLSTSMNETNIVNGTIGSKIDESIPILSDVFLDGQPISKENISDIYDQDLPNYATFDKNNFTITGTFPNTSTTDNFTIVVKDIYGNSVELPYSFDVVNSIFTIDSLKDVNATRGQYFQYQILKSYFTDAEDTKVTVDFGSGTNSDWLQYHDSNMTLSGITPKNFNSLKVEINAESNSDKESKSFQIKGVDKKIVSSSSSSLSTSSSSSAASATASASSSFGSSESSSSPIAHKKSNKNKALAIGLGVGIPVFLILVAALILLCCCLKRRKNKNNENNTNDNDEYSNEFKQPRKPMPPINGIAGAGAGAGAGALALAAGAGAIVATSSNESIKDESTMNVFKLEHNYSKSSSSLTQVETSSSESFYDTHENTPIVKSWRANTESDSKLARISNGSLATVNTENLFLVRLIDDYSVRNSETSSKFLSSNSLNALLRRESLSNNNSNNSTNFQRLDSNGNIVGELNFNNNNNPKSNRSSLSEKYMTQLSSPLPPPSLPQLQANLHIVPEEKSRDLSHTGKDETTGTISNLLLQFNDNRSKVSDDEFNSSSRVKQQHQHPLSRENSFSNHYDFDNRLPSPNYALGTNSSTMVSPSSDTFLLDESTPINNNHITNTTTAPTTTTTNSNPNNNNNNNNNQDGQTMQHQNLSAISLGSINSDKFFFDKNHTNANKNSPSSTPNSLNIGKSAKLVDFTRKGSLRESAYEPDYIYTGQSASIQIDDSD